MKLIRMAAITLGVASLVSFGTTYTVNHRSTSPTVSKRSVTTKPPTKVPAPAPVAPTSSADPLTSLPADMAADIAAQSGLQASASLINLDTGKEYDAGLSDTPFTAASTSKLVAVFDYMHQVELGKATLAQNVGGMSGQENIMRMIVYSDNDAWARLNKYLTFRGEQAYLNALGVSALIQEDDMQFSTPNMAKLLQLMYNGQLMNSSHQQLIYGYMANTTVKNLIQAALPATATVYHKYGQLAGDLHDAAIVQYAGHNLVLVIYTNNQAASSSRYSDQVDLIHAITATVLNDMGVS